MKKVISGCVIALVITGALSLAPSATAAAKPVEDMGCGMVLWAKENIFEHPSGRRGMVSKFKGCLVKRGWSPMKYQAMKDRQWRLNKKLDTSECTASDYYLSGVRRAKYKGIKVVVFKYRFGYLIGC